MRLTCLRCGNQMELVASGPRVGTICTCGTEISYPEVYNTGVRPNERAAERLRYKAFRAAGLVKNIGGFAMGLAFLGILFFPLALVGAVIGMYVLTMVRGPLGRYSGRNAAIVAIAVGVGVFATETSIVYKWIARKRTDRYIAMQTSAPEDLRKLFRTQRLYRAAQDRYGSLKESRFAPVRGVYTIYLGADDYVAAVRDDHAVTDPLPPGLKPKISPDGFTAYAVANLDGDPELDVWSVDDSGEVKHLTNDVPWLQLPVTEPLHEEPPPPIVKPEVLTASPGASAKTAKERADAAKEAEKVAEKAKSTAVKAQADAEKAKLDADKAQESANKAQVAAEKAAADVPTAEPAKADAAKAAAQKAADTAKAELAKAETARTEAGKKAELAKDEGVKAEAAKANATKAIELARLEAEQAKKNEELAKAEAEAAKKLAADKAAADKAAADAVKKADAEKAALEKSSADAAKKADADKAAAEKAAADAAKKAGADKAAAEKSATDAAKQAVAAPKT